MLGLGILMLIIPLQNVLEGIGLLMKQGKNHVVWNDDPPQTAAEAVADAKERSDSDSEAIGSPPRITKTTTVSSSAEYEELKKKLERLKEEERTVDRYLEYLKEQAAIYNGQQPPTRDTFESLPPGVRDISDNMYVRFKDITAMPEYRSETVIGIRAPTGTSLEVPDPDQGMKPGQRRFEMYLSSKGGQGSGKGAQEKGEPINVYLVQPRADQQNKPGHGRQGGFIQQETPPPPRGPGVPPSTSQRKSGNVSPPTLPVEGGVPPPGYGPPSRRHGEPPYGMPAPHRGGEWGYGPGGRPPYPTQERSYRKDGPPPPGNPPPGHSHPESAWGPPPPYGAYGAPPPGYHQSRGPPRPGSSHSPDPQKSASTKERSRDEGMYPPSSRYPSQHEGGNPRSDRGNPFRPRSHHYQTSHELGRTASSGGEPPRDSHGAFRPPSPSQQNLLNMPLQSPSEGHYFPSPTGAPGFSPPGGPRTDVRAGDVEFPMPTLPREGRDYRERWHPPHPKLGSSSSRPDEAPHHNVRPRR